MPATAQAALFLAAALVSLATSWGTGHQAGAGRRARLGLSEALLSLLAALAGRRIVQPAQRPAPAGWRAAPHPRTGQPARDDHACDHRGSCQAQAGRQAARWQVIGQPSHPAGLVSGKTRSGQPRASGPVHRRGLFPGWARPTARLGAGRALPCGVPRLAHSHRHAFGCPVLAAR